VDVDVALNSNSAAEIDSALRTMLDAMSSRDASDLHLAPGLPPYLRVQGDLEPIPGAAPTDRDWIAAVTGALLGEAAGAALAKHGTCDGAFTASSGVRFRANAFRTLRGVALAIRRLEQGFRSLAELGLPPTLYELCELQHGLVAIAGPTGAGKSTTLATLIDRINATRACHVITIEDPIEYVHAPRRALVQQRQVGVHATGFHQALVSALREDPDVILLGEIRDLDTIRTAIRAAETGHLVLTTVHAGDCVGAIERMTAVFPADEQTGIRAQLALVLRAVVAQRLLVADGPRAVTDGHPRRVVASEVLRVTPAVAHQIASGKTMQIYAAMETGARFGMTTFDADLARLSATGFVSSIQAAAHSRSRDSLDRRAEPRSRNREGGES
jgi:twitching motility protein PilT